VGDLEGSWKMTSLDGMHRQQCRFLGGRQLAPAIHVGLEDQKGHGDHLWGILVPKDMALDRLASRESACPR